MPGKKDRPKRAKRSVLTVAEFAQAFGLSEWAIYNAIGKKDEGGADRIPIVRVGRNVFIPLRKARELWPEVFGGDLRDVLIEEPSNAEQAEASAETAGAAE